MFKPSLEQISFVARSRGQKFEVDATHKTIYAGILRAQLYSMKNDLPFVGLNTLQTAEEFRGIGIAKHMVSLLVTWSKERRATSIGGSIRRDYLLSDTVDHVARYLLTLGFTVEDNDFWMKL